MFKSILRATSSNQSCYFSYIVCTLLLLFLLLLLLLLCFCCCCCCCRLLLGISICGRLRSLLRHELHLTTNDECFHNYCQRHWSGFVLAALPAFVSVSAARAVSVYLYLCAWHAASVGRRVCVCVYTYSSAQLGSVLCSSYLARRWGFYCSARAELLGFCICICIYSTAFVSVSVSVSVFRCGRNCFVIVKYVVML